MLSRRRLLTVLPAACCQGLAPILRAALAGGGKRVAAVYPSSLEPCAQAVEGLRSRLAANDEIPVDLLDLNGADFAVDAAREAQRKPAAVVAVGSEALRAVLDWRGAGRIISTMALAADSAGEYTAGRVAAAVYLDIPIRALIAELRRIFPEKTRVGVIRDPRRGGDRSWPVRSLAPDPGLVHFAECASADELLPVFLAFRHKVDFVICLPDSTLYNAATARPLIMASIENRLPVVGFSPAFLHAGAAVAMYPDYRAVGEQTGDLVRRCLGASECGGAESPRKIAVAVNAKVLRLLGLAFDASANPFLAVVR
ncbi:MAG TPA: hypothetical protein VMU80_07015 [Bryobacteraceae bacterium]|nr:hypothetical protein [Bryobacteraceae bacterium]